MKKFTASSGHRRAGAEDVFALRSGMFHERAGPRNEAVVDGYFCATGSAAIRMAAVGTILETEIVAGTLAARLAPVRAYHTSM
ncbi:hypothetical protein [Bradyrhizobium sp. CER78]|uniref:hypothetical protein n=1 Tax=Bradyrhizobium sp. CER78 TaxID=3039162 RepID=UPI002446CC0C|nr:hypothetical protein [Bradyrhizobium sp. CER78]MDH2384869.1 hypothetical protein [Bradyrhizobium sp. CER78]